MIYIYVICSHDLYYIQHGLADKSKEQNLQIVPSSSLLHEILANLMLDAQIRQVLVSCQIQIFRAIDIDT